MSNENGISADSTPGVDNAIQPSLEQSSDSSGWAIKAGLWVSLLWLILLAAYISNSSGWSDLNNIPMDTMGSFLEGAFAPLAFLWFVLGYFTQQKELSQNTQAIKLQYLEMQKTSAQAVIQSQAIKASELHARRESFLSIAESVKAQLGSIMGFLMLSSQNSDESGLVPPEDMTKLWDTKGRNDHEVFTRKLLSLTFTHGERYAYKILFGTEIRQRHSENFVFNFERLLKSAEECDTNGMLHDAVIGSAHGFMYQRIINIRDNPPEGFKVGVFDFDPDTIDD